MSISCFEGPWEASHSAVLGLHTTGSLGEDLTSPEPQPAVVKGKSRWGTSEGVVRTERAFKRRRYNHEITDNMHDGSLSKSLYKGGAIVMISTNLGDIAEDAPT